MNWVIPLPRIPVTTRIISFVVGNPYKPSFATVTGKGDNPRYELFPCSWVPAVGWVQWVGFIKTYHGPIRGMVKNCRDRSDFCSTKWVCFMVNRVKWPKR